MDICGIGVICLCRSYFWGNTPQFFAGGNSPMLLAAYSTRKKRVS